MKTNVIEWGLEEVKIWANNMGLENYKNKIAETYKNGNELLKAPKTFFRLILNITNEQHLEYLENEIELMRTNSNYYVPTKLPSGAIPIFQNNPVINPNKIKREILFLKNEYGNYIELCFVNYEIYCNKTFLIGESGCKIGKSIENDITLNEESISRQHSIIYCNNKILLMKDLGSSNGTYIEIKEKSLVPGMLFTIGQNTFIVDRIYRENDLARLCIKVVSTIMPSMKDKDFFIGEKGVKIGRKAENDVILREDMETSGSHCQIIFDGKKFILRDLKSTNHTWLRLGVEKMISLPYPIYNDNLIRFGTIIAKINFPILSTKLIGKNLALKENQVLDKPQIIFQSYSSESMVNNEQILNLDNVCKNCLANERNCLFSCGHNLICFNCANNLKIEICPACNQKNTRPPLKIYNL